MSMRVRKLIGAVILVAFVTVYALAAMAIGGLKLVDVPEWQRFIYYIVAGIAWAFPALFLVRWMQRPD